jgi:hypothetical protein
VLPFEIMIQVESNLNPKSSNVVKPCVQTSSNSLSSVDHWCGVCRGRTVCWYEGRVDAECVHRSRAAGGPMGRRNSITSATPLLLARHGEIRDIDRRIA